MQAPRRAAPREGALPRRPEEDGVNGTTEPAEPCEDEAAGGSATAGCLDHMKTSPVGGRIPRMKTCSGHERSSKNYVVPQGAGGQQRKPEACAVGNWTAGQGRRAMRERQEESVTEIVTVTKSEAEQDRR